ISAGTSTMKLSGTGNQTMSGSQSVIALKDMTVAKTGGTVTLSKPVRVDGALTMTQGNIITSSTNKLEIGSSTSSLGSVNWTSGNVVGPMRRWFAGAPNSTAASGMFPVGLSNVNRYAQVNFTQAPGSGGYIDMEYKAGLPANAADWTYVTTPDGQLIQTFEDEGYWDITPYDASGNAYPSGLNTSAFTMKLRANGLTSVNDINVTRIIRSPGPAHTTWEPAGFHLAATGTTADFAIESNTVTGFSWFNIGSPSNNPLPVELVSFTGACDNGIINLTWQTASEFNSSHFDVEKSRDGENWQVLATIPSAGTSNELLTYQTADHNAIDGNNYFRLRQLDIDGTEKLYDPINVSCSEVTTGYFSSFPNPSGTSFQVVVNNKELIGTCTLNMVDATGKVIEQRTIEVKEGINMFVINQEMTPGIYFLNITNGTKTTQVIKHAVN
ncbi:MAG: T9SS type A sorting domain-containing protein, partial [Flavobacteriales bacterium]